MGSPSGLFASELRHELTARNRAFARGRAHVESYGNPPVVVYAPEDTTDSEISDLNSVAKQRHGNFFDASYEEIATRPEWMKRFNKVHTQAARTLPKVERRWRELDSSMSSDALLMNVFCAPGVTKSSVVRRLMGADAGGEPVFGWKARVPFKSGRFDRTEVDMRWDNLLVEAKLTESDFQACLPGVVANYRDFERVFDLELLPRIAIPVSRRKTTLEFPEDFTQEEVIVPAENWVPASTALPRECVPGFASYQLIRNVLAAEDSGSSFCVIHDVRRPDLRESWFQVMSAVKSAELRVRLQVLTWQELAAVLPEDLQDFLDLKYGIVAPGKFAVAVGGCANLDT